MKSSGSLWFWFLPPLLLAGIYGAYHFYIADRLELGDQPAEERPSQENGETDQPPPKQMDPRTKPPSNRPEDTPSLNAANEGETPGDLPPATAAMPTAKQLDLPTAEALLPDLVQTLTSHATALVWLGQTHLLRAFVGAVDCVANGISPRVHIGFFRPQGPFRVQRVEGGLQVDPGAYARYAIVADVVDSLDPSGCRDAYIRLEPVLDELYRDLGYTEGSFRTALERAIAVILDTPTPAAAPRLRQQGGVFVWDDPMLERLNEAQKHLLRMGPENVRRIQGKVRTLAAAIGLMPPP